MRPIMKPRKCREIPDEAFLEAIVTASKIRGWREPRADRWDIARVLGDEAEHVGDTRAPQGLWEPDQNLVLAKARKLLRRGVITGCACGCRGDFAAA